MVLHVLADAGEGDDDGDLVLAECRGRADAGDKEELGGAEDAGGEDDFFCGVEGVLETLGFDEDSGGGSVPVEENLFC